MNIVGRRYLIQRFGVIQLKQPLKGFLGVPGPDHYCNSVSGEGIVVSSVGDGLRRVFRKSHIEMIKLLGGGCKYFSFSFLFG